MYRSAFCVVAPGQPIFRFIRAAFELVRSEGEQALNFRSVAKKLGCSTQPVIYQFDTMEKLKNEVYNMADNYHTEYITKIDGEMKDILLSIGLRYIRFAVDEEMLFRFLFLSRNPGVDLMNDVLDSEEDSPVVRILKSSFGLDCDKCKKAFMLVFMFAHGYAVMLAEKTVAYDEEKVRSELKLSLAGAIAAVSSQEPG